MNSLWARGVPCLLLACLPILFVGCTREGVTEKRASNPPSPRSDLQLDEEWQHLNRSRIKLDDGSELETVETVETLEEPTDTAIARPDWIDTTPKRVGTVYREVVSSERYQTLPECHRALGPRMLEVVRRRVEQLTSATEVPELEQLGVELDYVLRDICHEEWVETVEASFGEMKIVHVLMEFNAASDDHLRSAMRDYQRRGRITKVGAVAGSALGCLALLFGLLRVDTYTRGYYSKRLFFGVPAAIIALVLLF